MPHQLMPIADMQSQFSPSIQMADLRFISTLAHCVSLGAAARELGISTAAVSKRLAHMEQRLGAVLVNRTTRRMSLTVEGETTLQYARKILADLADLQTQMGASHATPSGLLRVNATLGFGRSHIAPAVASFMQAYPHIELRLQLSVDPPPISEDAFDVCVRFGPPPDARVIAKKIAPNRRLLCATPAYLQRYGTPLVPADLAQHNCIGIRQGDAAYGVLKLQRSGKPARHTVETVTTRGNLTTNDGSIAVQWALAGLGVLLRAQWDVQKHLDNGELVQLLPDFESPDADIYAVYPPQHQGSARVREFVAHLQKALSQHRENP